MNNEQIFQLVFGLFEPSYVSKVEFWEGEQQKELHLTAVAFID